MYQLLVIYYDGLEENYADRRHFRGREIRDSLKNPMTTIDSLKN